MPYLTGTDPGSNVVRYQLDVPDDFLFRTAVKGALLELTRAYNWEQTSIGELTPDEAAELARVTYETFIPIEAGTGDMEYLATLDGVASSYLFDDIPDDYAGWFVRAELFSNGNTGVDNVNLLLDGYSGAGYDYQYWHIRSDNTTITGAALNSQTELRIQNAAQGTTGPSDRAGILELWVYLKPGEPEKTAFYRTFGFGNASPLSQRRQSYGNGWVLVGGSTRSLELIPSIGTQFNAGSRADLYGLRA